MTKVESIKKGIVAIGDICFEGNAEPNDEDRKIDGLCRIENIVFDGKDPIICMRDIDNEIHNVFYSEFNKNFRIVKIK